MREMVGRLKNELKKNSVVIFRYSIVGVMGTMIDIGGLFILVNYLKLPVLLAATFSFLLAVTNNFILNKNWTFKSNSTNNRKLFIKFLIVHVIGLSLNLFGMYVLVNVLSIFYIIAKIFVTGIVLVWNFLANKLWTFRSRANVGKANKGEIFISVIIPAYNEEKRIGKTINIVRDYLLEKNLNYELIIIDDGSKDKTREVVSAISDEKIKYVKLPINKGKGNAIKNGIEIATGKYILFTDADNSTPIEELGKFLDVVRVDDSIDILIGSRYLNKDSVRIKQSRYRIFISRVGNYLIRYFLLEGVVDTQCGFKLFKSAAAKEIFSLQKVLRFGFDIEVMVIAKNLGYKFKEIPVSWINMEGSRLRPVKDVLITAKDLIYIKLNLWAGRYNRD